MSSQVTEPTHSQCRALRQTGWVLYAASVAPVRLIVFVHGFRGGAVKTWRNFASECHSEPWWLESDLLFVGYDSAHETIKGVADRVRGALPEFFPSVTDERLRTLLGSLRGSEGEYEELILVGHSLGGLILRKMLSDVAHEWTVSREREPDAARPELLRASTRLFSPASAGFRAAGTLGLLRASPMWLGLTLMLTRSSAFTDLQPGSKVIQDTQRRTVDLVETDREGMRALRAVPNS